MADSPKRAERVSIVCLVLSLIFFVATFFLGRWSGFFEITSISWLALNAAIVSFVLIIQFHQRSLAEQEKLDASQFKKDEETAAIFQQENEQQTLFAVAQKRLQFLEKYVIPICSALIAVYQMAIGLYLFRLRSSMNFEEMDVKQPLICAVYMTAVAFVSFLISRYATGLSREKDWKPLKAAGSLLLAVAIVSFIAAVSLALYQYQLTILLSILGWVVPVLLLALGIEAGLNVILDIYRPRIKGQYNRAAIDSRLLGIVNEPGSMIHTVAGAIDYQFGFKVSQTWFYKLLAKAIVPLVLLSALTLYALSSVIIVSADEEGIIEHFGNPLKANGEVRKVGPGITFKLPWPIQKIYKYPTKKVQELNIGYVPKVDPETGKPERKARIWANADAHYLEEAKLLVASPYTGQIQEGAAPVSLVLAAVPVQYKVHDIYKFLYNNKDSEKLLEDICYRELTNFAANSVIEVGGQTNSLFGAGRAEAKEELTHRIQTAADKMDLGVQIVFVGLQGLHPPVELSSDYQKVIGAIQKREAEILTAMADRNRGLGELAGSVQAVKDLYALVQKYDLVKATGTEEEIEQVAAELDNAFTDVQGEIYEILQKAKSKAFERTTLAKATGERFQNQLKSYQASRRLYSQEQRLQVLEEALKEIRKYIVVGEDGDEQVFIIDMQEKLLPSLFDIGGFEEISQ